MSQVPLETYYDVLSFLIRLENSSSDSRVVELAQSAILSAYQEMPLMRRWKYYYARGRVKTDAAYTTGTVAYDHCVTPEHEALTRDGWKTYDQLNVGDEILSYDHDSETCSWQQIEHLHVYEDYNGEILDVRRKGRSVLRCTPNHRIPVFERKTTRKNGKNVHRVEKSWVTARELTNEMSVPLAAPIEQESCGPLTPRLVGLLSWCVTDGYNAFKHHGTARITQSTVVNAEKCRFIEDLLDSSSSPFSRDGLNNYRINREDYNAWRKVASSKLDLPRLFTTFGVQQANAAVEAMILAEASTNPKNSQKVFTQWGENRPVAEAFQIACLLAGKATNISTGTFRCENFGFSKMETRYQCPVRHSKHIKLARMSEWVPYKGVVWCPQVPSGAWVVRCNGAVMITGNSGGANERQLTLTTGTWPTNAARGWVLIDGVDYRVASRVSDSIITLSVNSNPGEDIAAGATYKWWRDTYPMPLDFIGAEKVIDHEGYWASTHSSPGTVQSFRVGNQSASRPVTHSFVSDLDYVGVMAIKFSPPPDAIYHWDFTYVRSPMPMRVLDYSTGTVSVSSTTVTGTGTVWHSDMVGCLMRFPRSGVNEVPTGLAGKYPYAEQRIITAVASATSLTIDAVLSGAYSGVKYRISDFIDIDYNVMREAFRKFCEYRFAENLSREDQGTRFRSYTNALVIAKEADGKRSFATTSPAPVHYWNDFDLGNDLGDSM